MTENEDPTLAQMEATVAQRTQDEEVVRALLQVTGTPRLLLLGKDTEAVSPPQGTYPFVVIKCGKDWVEGPVYAFWLLRHKKVLANDAYIVFLGVTDSPTWADLERTYGGMRFGTLFLMRYRGQANPGVLPSQRGLYMR